VMSERFGDVLAVEDVTHIDGDADALQRAVRFGDWLAELADDVAQAGFDLRHEHMQCLDCIALTATAPSSAFRFSFRSTYFKSRVPCSSTQSFSTRRARQLGEE
jgi:hypothetical protein